MQNGPKTKRLRPLRRAASFNVRAKSSTVPAAYRVSQNAQRNYERYLELGRRLIPLPQVSPYLAVGRRRPGCPARATCWLGRGFLAAA